MFKVIYLHEIIQLLLKATSGPGPLIAKLFTFFSNATEKCIFEETK